MEVEKTKGRQSKEDREEADDWIDRFDRVFQYFLVLSSVLAAQTGAIVVQFFSSPLQPKPGFHPMTLYTLLSIALPFIPATVSWAFGQLADQPSRQLYGRIVAWIVVSNLFGWIIGNLVFYSVMWVWLWVYLGFLDPLSIMTSAFGLFAIAFPAPSLILVLAFAVYRRLAAKWSTLHPPKPSDFPGIRKWNELYRMNAVLGAGFFLVYSLTAGLLILEFVAATNGIPFLTVFLTLISWGLFGIPYASCWYRGRRRTRRLPARADWLVLTAVGVTTIALVIVFWLVALQYVAFLLQPVP